MELDSSLGEFGSGDQEGRDEIAKPTLSFLCASALLRDKIFIFLIPPKSEGESGRGGRAEGGGL
jgi:hypothetical protein